MEMLPRCGATRAMGIMVAQRREEPSRAGAAASTGAA